MDFNDYQQHASETSMTPSELKGKIYYPAIGLAGEVGELLNKIKKIARDNKQADIDDIKGELGDVLWYVSELASQFGMSLEDVAKHNVAKLKSRKDRGMIQGSGDNR